MAVYISDSDHLLSAGGAAWKRSEECKLPPYNAISWYNALSSTRYQVLAFANACNLEGAVLQLYGDPVNRSVKVALEEQTAPSVWTERASVTLTADQIISYSPGSTKSCTFFFCPFVFSGPYAVTVAANTWRLAVSQTGGTTGNWNVCYQDAAKTVMVRACINDFTTGKPGATDCAIVRHTVTIDQSWTLGNQEDVVGTPWSLLVVCGGLLQVENPPAAAYTLTLPGLLYVSGDGKFYVGTGANRIPTAQQFTIIFSGPGAGKRYGIDESFTSYIYYRLGEIKFYGQRPTTQYTLLSNNAASGQAQLVVDDNASAEWSPGETVDILGGAGTNFTFIEHKIIQGIVGNTITLTTNLAYTHYAGHPVILRSTAKYGILISYVVGSGGTAVFTTYGKRALTLDGVFLNNAPGMTLIGGGAGEACEFRYVFKDAVGLRFHAFTSYNHIADHVCVYAAGGYIAGLLLLTSVNGMTVSNCCAYDTTATAYTIFDVASSANIILSNLYAEGGGAGIGLTNTTLVSASNLVVASATYGLLFSIAMEVTIGSIALDWISTSGIYFSSHSISNVIHGLTFAGNGGVTVLCKFAAGDYISGTLISTPTGALTVDTGNLTAILPGSMLNVYAFTAANDHRNYRAMGIIQSTGDGLVDTTVHTVGAGKFGMRFETLDDTSELYWDFPIPIGAIQSQTMTVAVWVKLNSANYWSGVHAMPRLTIDYDDGTEGYVEAAQTTDWQLLAMVFTPATNYGQINVKLSTETDQVGANSYVYFDDMVVLYPAGYSLDLGGMDLWAKGLPVVPPIATVLSARDIWTIQTSTLTGAGTIGKLLTDDIDTTISSRAAAATALSTAQWTDDRATKLDNLDATISSRATAVALAVVGAAVDVVRAATDLLPDGGALTSLAMAAALAVVGGVANAIKAKTDNLPDGGALTSLATGAALDATEAAILADTTVLKADLALVETDVALLTELWGGGWEITDNQMIFYKPDNVTEIMRFDLLDADGNPATEDVFARRRA